MPRRRSAGVALAIAFAASAIGLSAPAVRATHSPDALLPDLAVLAPSDIRIQVTASGKRLLRFTTVVVNIGKGPFKIFGYDPTGTVQKTDTLSVKQQIKEPDGSSSVHDTTATMFWSGDGHDHWHVAGIEVSKLYKLTQDEVATVKKTGFCFLDSYPYGSSKPAQFTSANHVCQEAPSGRVPMGVSVKWGDIYPATIAFQWIDITGLPNGDYKLKVFADPGATSGGQFVESDETNNKGWTKIHIGKSKVTVLGRSKRP